MANREQVIYQQTAERARAESRVFRFKPGRAILYLILILGAVLAVLPFFWMVSNSLMTLGETINRRWLPAVPQIQNYLEAWEEANFAKYFWNSVVITFTTCTGLLISSILAGYAFGRIRFVGRDVIFAILLSTLMIPESVTVIPSLLIIRGSVIPLPGGSWLNTLQALTVPFMANAFSIFLLRQFFAGIPNELWDAARIDGAGHLRFLGQIVLPISKAPIMTVLIFAFIGSWNAFMWPLLVTTRETWRPLMVGLWNFVTEAGPQTQLLMAGSVITIIPILILYFFTQKQFTEGIATTGLKG
ncbi:MAG: carbohydrate ABC transporter permease [Chloroflexi bacterium]|nr:carbohydrate ABC transporter permease [Chloroflexota bacterium]